MISPGSVRQVRDHRRLSNHTVRAYYARVASTYDDTFARVVRPATDRLTQELAVQPGEHVLDLCCGTGTSTIEMASSSVETGRVVGVDASVDMLDRARSKAGNANVEFVCRDVLDFVRDCQPSSFDVVTLRFALTYFDWQTLVPLLPPLLRAGGRLGIVTSMSDSLPQVQKLYKRFVRSPEPAVRLFGHTGMSLRRSWQIFQQLRSHFSRPSFIRVPHSMGEIDAVIRDDDFHRVVTWIETRTEWHASGLDLVQWLVVSGCVAEAAVEELSDGAFDFVRMLFADGLEASREPAGIPLDFRLGGIVIKRRAQGAG